MPTPELLVARIERQVALSYWQYLTPEAAETGIRTGELAGLRISDLNGNKLSVSQSVWHGDEQTPKTQNAVRVIALSHQLVSALWEQIRRQRAKDRNLLFSPSTGTPSTWMCFVTGS
jgi:integrase